MNDEKRMYFIQNIEALKNENVESHVTEYEVISDAHIVGDVTYGPYYFTIWEFSFKKEGEERKFCLRIRESPSDDFEASGVPKKSGFYHGGGIPDEIVALASLFLRRRFKLGSQVRIDDSPCLIPRNYGPLDSSLINGRSDLGELSKWLKLVERLDSNYHQKFILAVKLYHQALLMIEEHPDMAYLNLVSAIEVLCSEGNIEDVELADLNEKLAELVASIPNEDLRSKIEQAILERERFIKRHFVCFILNHIEEDFLTEEKPASGQIKPDELPDILERIYDQRSKTLHEGEPFPPSIYNPPRYGEQISPSIRMMHRGRVWEEKDFIPYPHFFERLVNHVLKTYLKRKQSKENANNPI